jgi:DNA-binding NtrC family response regulator
MLNIKILLIDDDSNDRLLIIRHLKQEFQNIEITQITDESEFYSAFEKEKFNCVITDYVFYWSDGLSILKTIKKLEPNMPVIMFTGTGDEEVAVKAMKTELDDYIIKKPKHFQRLAVSLKKILERYEDKERLKVIEEEKKQAFVQIKKNLDSFSILIDEIRNPLTIMIGLTEFCNEDCAKTIAKNVIIIEEAIRKIDDRYLESMITWELLKK